MLDDKHAYLIIAHEEPEVLRRLVSTLDDARNDIYIHFDIKLSVLPRLEVTKSKLIQLEQRLDVRWGDLTQIQTEILLLEKAAEQKKYAWFHLLSGTHLPLFSQNYIHRLFKHVNTSVFGCLPEFDGEVEQKLLRYNLFMRLFQHPNKYRRRFAQLAWRRLIIAQKWLGIIRVKSKKYIKATNWGSFNLDAVEYLLSCKQQILEEYKYTMCGDEFFAPTTLCDGGKKVDIRADYLFQCMGAANATFLTEQNLQEIFNSGCIFARKFTRREMALIDKIESIGTMRK